jgi:hypothetical protein
VAIVILVLLFEIRTKIRICPGRRMHADKLVRELRVPKPEKRMRARAGLGACASRRPKGRMHARAWMEDYASLTQAAAVPA